MIFKLSLSKVVCTKTSVSKVIAFWFGFSFGYRPPSPWDEDKVYALTLDSFGNSAYYIGLAAEAKVLPHTE